MHSNTTTTRSLDAAMAATHVSDVYTEESSDTMLDILSRQHFRTESPPVFPTGCGWPTRLAGLRGSSTMRRSYSH